MIRQAGSLAIDASSPALTGSSRQAPNQERCPSNTTSASRGACCLRCGGLLVTSYTASLEWDVTGQPVTLWRCINCGDCVDSFILANRGKILVPARRRARTPRGQQGTGRPREVRIGMTR